MRLVRASRHRPSAVAEPHPYQVPASVYHDITSGSSGGEKAAAGWGYARGFDSIMGNFNASL